MTGFCLAALGLVVRLAFFNGFQGSDDRNYIAYAYYFAHGGDLGEAGILTQWIGRIGLWLPISWLIWAFGASEVPQVLYPLLCSTAGVVLAWAFARHLFGERAGLVAGLLYAVFPLEVIYATRAYPDVPAGVWMSLGYFLVILGAERRRLALLAGAGLAAGLAYLAKETSVFFWVPAGLLVLVRRQLTVRTAGALALGFLVVLAAELVFWQSHTGDPLYRWTAARQKMQTMQNADLKSKRVGADDPRGWIPGPPPGYVMRGTSDVLEPALMFATNEEFGLIYYLVWPLVLVLLVRGPGRAGPALLWLIALTLLSAYFPLYAPGYSMVRDPRYYSPVSIAAVAIAAWGIVRMPRVAGHLTLGVLVTSSLGCIWLGWVASGMQAERALLARIQSRPDTQYWVGPPTAANLLGLSGFDQLPNVGMHLVGESDRSNAFAAVRLTRPSIPTARSTEQLVGQLVVLGPLDEIAPRTSRANAVGRMSHWPVEETIGVEPGPIGSKVQTVLTSLGVPARVRRRLLPSAGAFYEVRRALRTPSVAPPAR